MPAKGTKFNPATGKYEPKRQRQPKPLDTPIVNSIAEAHDIPVEEVPAYLHSEPVTIPPNSDFYSQPLETATPKIVIRRKQGLGGGSSEEEVEWPANWPLPKIGESISLGSGVGAVTDIRFDLDNQRVIISIK